ncbi:MAG: NAD(P)-dependent oxidoreductase [Chitinophagales bacterium]
MSTKRVLFTEITDSLLIDGLTLLGYSCVYDPAITQANVQQVINEFEGLIVATRIIVNKQLLESGTQLKFVARAGSGMENIDTEVARERKIICINSPEGNANAVGEHALGFLLAFYHNIVRANVELQQLKWLVEENRVHEVEDQTIGIIGYGNTGKSFAKKLAPLGMKVLAFDKYLRNYSDQFAKEASMRQLFDEADIISLHIPLTPETISLVDHYFLQQFSKKIFFINTSRGKLVVHAALLKHIKENRMAGAALDVYDNEKFESHTAEESLVFRELLDTGKVIVTPHIAGKSYESKRKIAAVLLRKIAALA